MRDQARAAASAASPVPLRATTQRRGLRPPAWYASIFLLGGAVLLAISYAIVSRNTTSFPTRVAERLTAKNGALAGVTRVRVQVAPSTKIPPALTGPDGQTFLRLERARKAAEGQVTADIHREGFQNSGSVGRIGRSRWFRRGLEI